MKNRFNILLIAFLLIFVSSCTKFSQLERKMEKGESTVIKSGSEDGSEDNDSQSGITDTDNEEDYDADATITDTDNEEDYDKENVKG